MKEISILVDNRPGILAEISELMAAHNINIENIGAETVGKTGIIVLSVDKYDEALRVLCNAAYNAVTEESLLIKLEDKPGALARIANRFKEANINIRGVHIVRRDSGYSIAAISTDRTQEAIELVKDILVGR